MRILILSRNKQLHSIRRLLAEAKKVGLHCDIVDPLDCFIVVDGPRSCITVGTQELPKVDAVFPRIGASITDYGIAVVKQLENLGVKAINGSQAIADSRDKMRCLQILASAGLRVPRTALICNSQSSRASIQRAVEKVGGMPVVMKILEGTQGHGVMVVHSLISLISVLETLQGLGQDVLIQEFVWGQSAPRAGEQRHKDYRVFVIGGKVVASMLRRAPRGEFRSNIHRGAEGIPVKLPKSYEKAAVRACKVLGLQVAGVDLMESEKGPLVIEVNSSPGFEGIERATGLNVGALVVKQICKQGRKRG